MEILNNYYVGIEAKLSNNITKIIDGYNNETIHSKGKLFKYTNDEFSIYNGFIINGKMNGYGYIIYITNNKNPTIKSYEGNFLNDEYDGDGTIIYTDGKVFKGTFSNGNKDGKGILYNSNGSIIMDNIWKNDVINGKIKIVENYHETSNIKNEGYLYNSIKVGQWISYHEDNTISNIQYYKEYDSDSNIEKLTEILTHQLIINSGGYLEVQKIYSLNNDIKISDDDLLNNRFNYYSKSLNQPTKNINIIDKSINIIDNSLKQVPNRFKIFFNNNLKNDYPNFDIEKNHKQTQILKLIYNYINKKKLYKGFGIKKTFIFDDQLNELFNTNNSENINFQNYKKFISNLYDLDNNIENVNNIDCINNTNIFTEINKIKDYALEIDKKDILNNTLLLYLDNNCKMISINEVIDGIEYPIIIFNNQDKILLKDKNAYIYQKDKNDKQYLYYQGEVNNLYQPHGNGIKYETDGKIKFEGIFQKGNIESGLQYSIDKNNKQYVKYKGTFLNGLPHGEGTYYYENNNKEYEGQILHNKKHGNGISYYDNGNKCWNGNWHHNIRHGLGSLYDDNGDLICNCIFEYDNIINVN